MARTQKYKKLEKKVASKTSSAFFSFLNCIKNGAQRIFKILDGKLTIMIVPHSQSKVVNQQEALKSLSVEEGYKLIGQIT